MAAVRTYRAIFMIQTLALYMGTAYWLESRGAASATIATAFAAQGAIAAILLPAVLRRYSWSLQLKCAAALAWLVASGMIGGILGLRSLPANQEALALLAWLAVVVLLYVLHFRRRCPD
jgi:hypothetical protein